ncbi:MAG: ParB/RepB/Spo0J family partition protein [Nitrospinae bacterium]|nr:ParB/RepB/Spo0J family partition protein [Nitrospinota bacterium]MBI3815246.1 ParB/RepB/Spo0J family partition protein [Nitrospinota bacterium]
MQRRALGKGLKALIPVAEEKQAGILEIPIEDVRPNRYQPRKTFDDSKLAELVSSIKEKGVVQPIIVQKLDSGYELIAGERRWRAAQKAGMDKIPALIKEVTNEESLELALIENIQRENLNSMEESRAYQRLADEFNLTQEEISKKVGKDRSSIANYLRLLKLPQEIQDSISNEELTMGHARALLSLNSAKEQISLKDMIIEKGMSVREIESIINRDRQSKREPAKRTIDIFKNRLGEELQRFFGTKVNIIKGRKRGKIEIVFYSDEDLERIVELIRG